jgi:hypothetical protein
MPVFDPSLSPRNFALVAYKWKNFEYYYDVNLVPVDNYVILWWIQNYKH